MQHEKKATQEKCILGKAKQECNPAKVQHESSPTWKKHSDRAKFGMRCKKRIHYCAQKDNGPSVKEPLCTGQSYCFFYFCKTIHIALFSFLPGNIHHISMTFNHVGVWVFTFLWAMLWFRVFRGFMLYCAVMQFILEIRFNCHHLTTHLCF